MSKVYFSKTITPERIVDLYKKLDKELTGNKAIKVHTGEIGNQNYIKAEFLKPIVDHVGGTIVECNTAYPGERFTTEKHMKTAEAHNWTKYYKVDILDGEGDEVLPIENGVHLKENYVGTHMKNYDSVLVVSHFKGAICGFGGAVKQLSIGFASKGGKVNLHTAGASQDPQKFRELMAQDKDFKTSMADCASSIVKFFKGNINYINVLNNISMTCDCDSKAAPGVIKDIGILASTDPVAIDQACIDLIKKSDEPGKNDLIKRFEDKLADYLLESCEKLGVGKRQYELINID